MPTYCRAMTDQHAASPTMELVEYRIVTCEGANEFTKLRTVKTEQAKLSQFGSKASGNSDG